ncbi:trehalose-phosphatase [Paracoccus sp. Z330]|uniref:Trehalose 6-phosphate phosphatase n=1 Tax=Paracoccus onchidii TaxID=3017813 RepID=A0ABT4ZEP7_9RHOB|nr:trehalose-phosphatase [Paracoccus onchidii]MDB6177150.1 trehalose-phosphatase [Paracoccus onchidii]
MNPPELPDDAALFLDFDGCLVEIAARPDAIVVPAGLPDLLRDLFRRQGGALALVSGRSIADLRRYLPDFPGAMSGSHGAELSLNGGDTETAHGLDLDVAALHRDAATLSATEPAILIEQKPHGVVMHYRANPGLRHRAEEIAGELLSRYAGLVLQPAKMAIELRPDGVGKDKALIRLMSDPPFRGRRPVYIGDDLTDEVAMEAAQRLGGFAIKIGSGKTGARHRLGDPAALAAWLSDGVRS